MEWKKEPVNFLDVDTLRWIMETYQDKYQIIYNRFRPEMGYDDTVDTLDLGEFDMLKEYDVLTIQDLKRGGENWYHFFGGSTIHPVHSDVELKSCCKKIISL
jgi:hypothetical protein